MWQSLKWLWIDVNPPLDAAARACAAVQIQFSNDLGVTDPWAANAVTVPDASGTVGGVVFTITPNNGMLGVVAEIPASAAAPSQRLSARLAGIAGAE